MTCYSKAACGAAFISKDGRERLVCHRDAGRHLFHRDDRLGLRFVRLPGGAFVKGG